ncbi:MAG: hypothetical protein PHG46_03415 [Candidatus Omnitrophica bacterium]|jgi:hypothetical protein|nr:hypothetical protein [Candidatus Omnitrophota bacterium]
MLNVDFSWALCAVMLAVTAAVAAAFLSLREGRGKSGLSLDARHVWLCAICTHIYINTKDDKISLCPRCGSYNSRDSGLRPSAARRPEKS